MFKLCTFTLAALALAVAAEKTCVSETKYSLDMFLGDSAAPLYALDNGPEGTVILVADPELTYPGTPSKSTSLALP